MYNMANNNGILPACKVARSGTADSAIFALKGAPITSPLFIESPDKTQTAGIYCNDNGNMVIASDSDGTMYLGSGSGTVQFYSPNQSKEGSISSLNNGNMVIKSDPAGDLYLGNGRVIIPSTDGTDITVLTSANDGTSLIQCNDALRLVNLNTSPAAQFSVQKGSGTIGQIYDTVYNQTIAVTSQERYSGVAAPLSFSNLTLTLQPGNYQIQMFAETVVPQIGTRLRLYLSGPNPSSNLVDYASASLPYDSTTIAECSMTTPVFVVEETGEYQLRLASSGANWTATQYGVQIVKLG